MRMLSEEAVEKFEDKSLDWVYVDGNHQYHAVLNDLRIWKSKIKDGGYILGHDYNNRDHPQVKKAVDQFVNESEWEILKVTKERVPSYQLGRVV